MVSRHQIKKAIEVLEEATAEGFKELTQELLTTIKHLKYNMKSMEDSYKMACDDMGKAQIVYGFDDKFFANHNPPHTFAVQNFIQDWIIKQSDWKLPWCILLPNKPRYLERCLKAHLIYVCSNNQTQNDIQNYVKRKLKKQPDAEPNMFRIKPLDHRGIIDDYDVPHNQISFLLSFDYFPYLSVEQIKNYFIYIEKCLRPGGEAMIHITDADNEDEWKSVVAKKVTYCNGEIIKDYVNQVGLEFVNSYPIDSGYTFFHFKKTGTKFSIKKDMTKISPIA
tara:strand:+ start:201 stop:1037 length:837 start_codon:yes stop_codon:yes gene_type:complete